MVGVAAFHQHLQLEPRGWRLRFMLYILSSEWVGDCTVPNSQRAQNPNYQTRQRDGSCQLTPSFNDIDSHWECAINAFWHCCTSFWVFVVRQLLSFMQYSIKQHVYWVRLATAIAKWRRQKGWWGGDWVQAAWNPKAGLECVSFNPTCPFLLQSGFNPGHS